MKLLFWAFFVAVIEGVLFVSGWAIRAHSYELPFSIEAQRRIVLSAEITGKITSLPLAPGEAFPIGTLLFEIDCASQQDGLDLARLREERARILMEESTGPSVSTAKKREAEWRYGETRIERDRLIRLVGRCSAWSKWAGIVAQHFVHEQEWILQGSPILEIFDAESLVLIALLPYQEIAGRDSAELFFEAVFTGHENRVVSGRMTRIAPSIDRETGHIRVYGQFRHTPPFSLRPGMRGNFRWRE